MGRMLRFCGDDLENRRVLLIFATQNLTAMSGISRMLDFLALLKENNNRPWFAAHKDEYEEVRSMCHEEVDGLIGSVSHFDARLAGLTARECTYRIYRDVRFSADKSPFKTHFGIVLAKGGRKCKEAGWYLHIEPDGCALYGGVWFPDAPVLNFLRRNIYDNIDEFLEIINAPDFKRNYPELVGDSLKMMPKGYPKGCEYGEILKRKEFLVQKKYKNRFFDSKNWREKVAEDIRIMKPFTDFLNYAFEELHMG